MLPLLIAATLSATSPSKAKSDGDGDEETQTAPDTAIVITGRRLDIARARVEPSLGASSYSLTNDAIENRPGGETKDIGAILVQVPGVRRDGNGTLVVRGSPGGVQYRLNNIILPDGVADFGETLSARLAARTELITGALPAQYGLTSGGVVNVTTKSGLYDGGDGQAELYGGSHRTIQPAFEWAGARGGTSLFTSGSYRRSDIGIALPDGGSRSDHDRSSELEAFAFADHVIDADSRVSLILGTSNERNQILALTLPGGPGANSRHGDQVSANHYAIASFQIGGDKATVQASVFGLLSSEVIRPHEAASVAIDGVSRGLDERRQSAGAQLEAAYDWGSHHTLRAGVVASVDRDRRDERRATALRLERSRAVTHRTTASAFLQDEWRLTSNLTANAGIRADQVSGLASGARLGPRASVTWATLSGFTGHFGYARYFVAPPVGDDVGVSDGRLRGETDDYLDVGAEEKLGDFKIGIDAYWRNARNLIAERRWDFAPIGESFNYRRARLNGVELLMTYADGPLAAWSNLAVGSAKAGNITTNQSLFTPAQVAYAVSHDVRIDQDQRLTGSAGLSYRFGPLLLSGDMLYGSGTRRTSDAVPNGAKLRAHLTLDLAAVYRLKLVENHPLDLRLDVTNLLDRRYALSDGTGLAGGAPEWGARRGVFIGVEQGL